MSHTKSLPVQAVLPELLSALSAHHHVVLEAPPGAGKTTQVPLALLGQPWLAGRKILLLQPRRMAARAVAERMAQLLGEEVGQRVGYRVRLESRVSRLTRIEVVTEGILTRMLLDDPSLAEVGLVIFDEFHERNLESDLSLALCLQGRRLFRDENDPLKILVMSATLQGDDLVTFLENTVKLSCEGRLFPVTVHYGAGLAPGDDIVTPVVQTLLHVLSRHEGNALVFLPGQHEILRVKDKLAQVIPAEQQRQIEVLPLYGALPLAEQQYAITPTAGGGKRRVVLATDIAETSLTIEGITVVIDAGLKRIAEFDPARGMSRLRTVRVSAASSTQRMGRAGRLSAGHCYRLWSEAQQKTLQAYDAPEILQADLCSLALNLLDWGVSDPAELDWLTPPPTGAYQQAMMLLQDLGAVNLLAERKVLSEHGRAMASWPVHPRLAHMLEKAKTLGALPDACLLAAVLMERDPLRYEGVAISRRMQRLTGEIACESSNKGWLQRVKQQAQSYRKMITAEKTTIQSLPNDELWGLLLAWAYPDRIAKRRPGLQAVYQLSQGNALRLADDDPLAACEWLVVADMGGLGAQDKIFLAADLNPDHFDTYLAPLVTTKDVVEWDSQAQRFIAEQRHCIGALILRRRPLAEIPLAAKREHLLAQIRKQGLACLPWTETLQHWRARVNFLQRFDPSPTPWPDLSDEALLEHLDSWLGPYLDSINSLKALQQLDLSAILAALLPWPLPQQLEQEAPSTWCVPSNSHIRIDYSQTPPVLAVKLQEMFGCAETPSLLQGRVKLMVHLLSPAQRPLQITQDLAGFWQSSYHDIKKEMKGRYPKHPWPDDPINTAPTRFTKKRLS
ncbi:MAG TPA: ATP-dependent helicase HrpB [Pseudomonadales bacterium]|nr:ATP-dependent helicase HrpB [Pseudomonadales bacterium]